jgi:hypothetical protein
VFAAVIVDIAFLGAYRIDGFGAAAGAVGLFGFMAAAVTEELIFRGVPFRGPALLAGAGGASSGSANGSTPWVASSARTGGRRLRRTGADPRGKPVVNAPIRVLVCDDQALIRTGSRRSSMRSPTSRWWASAGTVAPRSTSPAGCTRTWW